MTKSISEENTNQCWYTQTRDTQISSIHDKSESTEARGVTLKSKKAWGFFNNSSEHLSKRLYMLSPLPDDWKFNHTSDISYLYTFMMFYRFDAFRPLYKKEDYFFEFFYLLGSLVILPINIFNICRRLTQDISNYHKLGLSLPFVLIGDLFIGLLSIFYCAVVTTLSLTFSLLGLVTRPLMTALLGTNDPELQLEMTRTTKNQIEFCYIKGGQRTEHKGVYTLSASESTSDWSSIANSIDRHLPELHIKASERTLRF